MYAIIVLIETFLKCYQLAHLLYYFAITISIASFGIVEKILDNVYSLIIS